MKRIAAGVIACFLVIGLFARTASAQRAAESNAPTAAVTEPPTQVQVASADRKDKLKADVAKLLAETKTGKRSVVPSSQFPPPHSNNLSKTAKIGIVVIVVVVVLAIVVVKNFKYECESHCVGL
jgi:preprotein translocase subunit SecF